jgi:lipid-A-disaccharide synthase
MIFSGEYSGSLYGSLLARRLRELRPGVRLTGVGGHHMEEAGVELHFDSSGWGGIGPMEALKRSPLLAYAYFKLKAIIHRDRPDLIILIDFPGFNMLVARVAKGLGIPTLYYFPPGKYRSAPEDVLDAARTVTRVAAPLKFSFEKYTALKAAVDFVGHPLLDVLSDVDEARTRAELGVGANERVVGLLPGSRLAELEYHTGDLCRAAARLHQRFPDQGPLMDRTRQPGNLLRNPRRRLRAHRATLDGSSSGDQ